MDEEYSESDIPTVLIRSVADCPVQEVSHPVILGNTYMRLFFFYSPPLYQQMIL
jgi:hypothetical protein